MYILDISSMLYAGAQATISINITSALSIEVKSSCRTGVLFFEASIIDIDIFIFFVRGCLRYMSVFFVARHNCIAS